MSDSLLLHRFDRLTDSTVVIKMFSDGSRNAVRRRASRREISVMIPAGNRGYKEIVEQEGKIINRALELFVSDVSQIPQVVRVEVLGNDEGIDIWIFIEERDPAVRTKIHECQFRLLESFPRLMVDFHIVSNPQRSFYGTRGIYSKAH